MAENLLICGTNWLGDCVMSMPGIQALRAARPAARLTLLSKESLLSLWRMHPAVDALITLHEGLAGTLRAVKEVRAGNFERACVLSHSHRAALIPFIARVPERLGTAVQSRDMMLTEVVEAPAAPGREHQSFEYARVLGLDAGRLPDPRLEIPGDIAAACRERLASLSITASGGGGPLVGMIPGAARGPSKRWPQEGFVAVGRGLVERAGARILVLGTSGESGLCAGVTAGIGAGAVDMAGSTTLPELAAILASCSLAVGNDSGGGHLAAAVGTRAAVVFGATDPAVTGPLGAGHAVFQAEGVERSRAVKRDSDAGRAGLERITPDRVLEAVLPMLDM
jgi:heptosyltransferase-2